MYKKVSTCIAVFLMVCLSSVALAKSAFIYRQQANWVKIIKADSKEVPLGELTHPYTEINSEQIEAMLLSIKISKRYLLKKEIKTVDVFNAWEARKYAPFLMEALAKVDPDHVVHFSVVHKRPIFILQNDYITMGNLWVESDGIHFQFTKLFATLDGDYNAAHNLDKALRRAKSRRLTLEANGGQTLLYADTLEIVLDPKYDFITQAQKEAEESAIEEETALKGKTEKKSKEKAAEKQTKTATKPVATTAVETTTTSSPATLSVSEDQTVENEAVEKLRKLEVLKDEGLISKKEYNALRKKYLTEL